MLVLSRKVGQSVEINGGESAPGGCTVTVVEIRGDKCRIGFSAGNQVPIHRREVHEAIQREAARQEQGNGDAA